MGKGVGHGDPPGSYRVNGTLMVPFQGPKPAKRPKGSAVGRVGRYSAPVDTTGMTPEEKDVFNIGK
jgi:hypothetical protein